jgi:hypothetical protein
MLDLTGSRSATDVPALTRANPGDPVKTRAVQPGSCLPDRGERMTELAATPRGVIAA